MELILMGEEENLLNKLVLQEKKNLAQFSNGQTHFDEEKYNDELATLFSEAIVTGLETNSLDSPLLKRATDPFSLGTILEINRMTQISPWLNSNSEDFTQRKATGMYYTPKSIVEYIVEKSIEKWLSGVQKTETENVEKAVERWMNLTIIDPACGSGSFLIVAANKLEAEYAKFITRNGTSVPGIQAYQSRLASHILHGVDIDPIAVRVCAASVRFHLGLGPEHPTSIHCGDTLTAPIVRTEEEMELEGWPDPLCFSTTFPEIFNRERNGFDIVIMNPPYGKLRVEKGKGFGKGKKDLEFEKKRYKALGDYIRKSGLYPKTKGVLNWYKLFIERAMQLLDQKGSLGFIVPSTILCDSSTKGLRELLLEHDLRYLFEIPEKNKFFDSVTQSYAIGIVNKGEEYQATYFKFGITNMRGVSAARKPIDLVEITKLSLGSLSIPLTTDKGLKIYSKIHKFPVISEFTNIENARGEIDQTEFKPHFQNQVNGGGSRLLRGADINFFRISSKVREEHGYINRQGAIKKMGKSEKTTHLSRARLVGQQVTNQNNSDRLIFAMAEPGTFFGNSLNYIFWNGEDVEDWNHVLLGLLNSTLLDWRFRITSSNNHVANGEIGDLPIPIGDPTKPILNNQLRKIGDLANQLLHCENQEIESLKDLLDKAVFSTYGLTANQIELVLSGVGEDTERVARLTE